MITDTAAEKYEKLSINQYLKQSGIGVTRQAIDYAITVSKKIDAIKTTVFGRDIWLVVMTPKTLAYRPNASVKRRVSTVKAKSKNGKRKIRKKKL